MTDKPMTEQTQAYQVARGIVDQLMSLSDGNLDFIGLVEIEMKLYREELTQASRKPIQHRGEGKSS